MEVLGNDIFLPQDQPSDAHDTIISSPAELAGAHCNRDGNFASNTEYISSRNVDEVQEQVPREQLTLNLDQEERMDEVHDKATRPQWKRDSTFYYRNLAIFSLTFFFAFCAFLPLQTLQSSLNHTLGFVSLTVLYTSFILSSVISPFFIKMFGAKYVIVACYAAHCFYIICNFYPSYYTLLPGSAVVGFASGPLWTSATVYVTNLASGLSATFNKSSTKRISIFTGVLFLIFFASSWVGNGFSSGVLLIDSGGLYFSSNHSNRTNGTGDSEFEDSCVFKAIADVTSPWAFYLLMSLFLLFDISAFFVSLCCLEQTGKQRITCSPRRVATDFTETFVGFVKALFGQRYLLAAPLQAYQGFNMGMLQGMFSKWYITDCVGVGFVGLSQIVWGVGSSLSSIVAGEMITKIPRSFVVAFGLVEDFGFLVFLLIWEKAPSLPAVFLIVLFWGIGDGIWNTIPTSYVGIVTREEKQEAGYSLQSFWVAFGFAINFFVSGYISATFNFTIMVCFLLVAVVFFVIGDEAQTSSTKEFFKSLCMRKNKGSDMDDPNSLLDPTNDHSQLSATGQEPHAYQSAELQVDYRDINIGHFLTSSERNLSHAHQSSEGEGGDGVTCDAGEAETVDGVEGENEACNAGETKDCGEGEEVGDCGEGEEVGNCGEWDEVGDCGEGDEVGDCGEWDEVGDCGEGDEVGNCGEGEKMDYDKGEIRDCSEGETRDCGEGRARNHCKGGKTAEISGDERFEVIGCSVTTETQGTTDCTLSGGELEESDASFYSTKCHTNDHNLSQTTSKTSESLCSLCLEGAAV